MNTPNLRRVLRLVLVVLGCLSSAPAEARAPTPSHVAATPADAGRLRHDTEAPPAVDLAAAREAREHVAYDVLPDGSTFAVGATYKAAFDAEGAVYAPFLGSRAPQNYPVRFRLVHAALGTTPIGFDAHVLPERTGDVVRYPRGELVEIYELALDSVEQLFAFERLPRESAGGDLVVRIACETELVAREVDEGFRFENELGAVRYGRATAIDARGATVAAPTVLTEQGIEIRVPADFVASARLPLVIDPVVSTFTIDTTTIYSFDPDVAYSATDDRWLCVYEEIFSASDHDIRYRLLSPTGASLQTGYVESSLSAYWAHPAVASVTNTFLVVAEVGLPSSGARTIQGRVYNATTTALEGASFAISGSFAGADMVEADVGGRGVEQTLPYRYAVVWRRITASNNGDILYRLAEPAGFAVGNGFSPLDVSSPTIDSHPSISKSNAGGKWNVAWQRQVGSSSHDLRCARIAPDGSLAVLSTSIDTSIFDTFMPKASSSLTGTNRWLVACQEFNSGWNVTLRAIDGATVIDSVDLSALEAQAGAPGLAQSQLRPDVDTDGESFAVVYAETASGGQGNIDTYVATVALTGSQINLSEGHRILGGSFTVEDFPSIASRGAVGGGLRRAMTVWHNVVDPTTHANVEGGLYDAGLYTSFCNAIGGGDATCPCGNPPSTFGRGCNNSSNTGGGMLSLFGLSSLSGDTLNLFASQLKPSALSIFNQGDAVLASSVPFGQGARCVGGAIKRLYMTTSLSGGTASVPQSGDPNVHTRSAALGDVIAPGSTRAYYVYYRDPVVLGGCPSGNTYNTTQSVQAIWIP